MKKNKSKNPNTIPFSVTIEVNGEKWEYKQDQKGQTSGTSKMDRNFLEGVKKALIRASAQISREQISAMTISEKKELIPNRYKEN